MLNEIGYRNSLKGLENIFNEGVNYQIRKVIHNKKEDASEIIKSLNEEYVVKKKQHTECIKDESNSLTLQVNIMQNLVGLKIEGERPSIVLLKDRIDFNPTVKDIEDLLYHFIYSVEHNQAKPARYIDVEAVIKILQMALSLKNRKEMICCQQLLQ